MDRFLIIGCVPVGLIIIEGKGYLQGRNACVQVVVLAAHYGQPFRIVRVRHLRFVRRGVLSARQRLLPRVQVHCSNGENIGFRALTLIALALGHQGKTSR